jgi:hypothetical protein
MPSYRLSRMVFVLSLVFALVGVRPVMAADESDLTKEQIEHFLLTAKVLKSKASDKGFTHPFRLTLSDGTITHDGSFQGVDEHERERKFFTGQSEFNFVDSYKYNIAAYRLAELLGLDDLVPVYVERRWDGKVGSLSWWLPVQMDEADRIKKKVPPPDPEAWNKQMYKIRVLDQLVYDTDANLTNVLITEDWKIWRVDFTRAFRLHHDLQEPKDLVRCDRQLLAKLKALDGGQLAERTKGFLSKSEVNAVMARRDKILARFQKLVAEKGEDAVLY